MNCKSVEQATAEANNLAAVANAKNQYSKDMEEVWWLCKSVSILLFSFGMQSKLSTCMHLISVLQGWEFSSFCWNSGFLRGPGVILKIHLDSVKMFHVFVLCNLWVFHMASTSYNLIHHFIPRWYIHIWRRVGLFGNTAQKVAIHKFVYKFVKQRESIVISEAEMGVGIESCLAEEIFVSLAESKRQRNYDVRQWPHVMKRSTAPQTHSHRPQTSHGSLASRILSEIHYKLFAFLTEKLLTEVLKVAWSANFASIFSFYNGGSADIMTKKTVNYIDIFVSNQCYLTCFAVQIAALAFLRLIRIIWE